MQLNLLSRKRDKTAVLHTLFLHFVDSLKLPVQTEHEVSLEAFQLDLIKGFHIYQKNELGISSTDFLN